MTTPHLVRSLLAAVAVAALAHEAAAQTPDRLDDGRSALVGEIRGRLEGVVMPLPHAVVEVVSRGVRRSAVADATGRYSLQGLSAGEVTVSVTHVGYAPLTLTVTLPGRDFVTVDLELAATPVALPPVDVVGDATASRRLRRGTDDFDAPLPDIDLEALDVGPGVGQPGLAEVVAALPGNDPGDATDILFMRGSTADLKLVLLDGVPVYTPFHVAGLMKSFEQSVLGAAELHVGGAPARFDGGLTHILELRTRTARRDKLRVSGSVDFLAASTAIETPLGDRAGLIASARSLHGLGDAPLGGAAPYGYRDALLAASLEPAAGHEVRSTGFWNEESVLLDAENAPGSARWANRAGSLAYRADLGGARLDLTVGVSAYEADLPLQPSLPRGSPAGTPLPSALLATAATDRARALGEVTWGSPSAPVRAGLSLERIAEHFTARSLTGAPGAVIRGAGGALGTFLDVTRPLGEGLTLRAGARVDYFEGGSTHLAPRAAISWEVGPEALVTVAAGRYHQPTRTSDVEVDRTLESLANGETFAERLQVATADHVVLSLDQHLSRHIRMGLEGFWKSYRDLPSAARESVTSSGVDLRIVTADDRRAAWLGYGLSWFWSSMDLSGRASEFVGRHLLSAGVSGRLLGPFQAEARLAYGAGLPYTSIPFGTESAAYASTTVNQVAQGSGFASDMPLVEGLDETFLRLDLEVHATLEPTWGGRTIRVRPYVRILNALDRRDALFYTYQPWRSESLKPLAERPILPLLGVAFSF